VFRCIKQHTSLHHSSPNTSLGKLKYTPTTCAVQCEEILENLEQMNIELDGGMASYPDLISYHFVMDAWAKSCHHTHTIFDSELKTNKLLELYF